jgi:hypothetical protein
MRKVKSQRELWLSHYGGRTEADVVRDRGGEYIELSAGKFQTKKLYLPRFDLSTPSCGKPVDSVGTAEEHAK